MESSASANNELTGFRTPNEKDYQKIGVAGRWYMVTSLSAIIIATLLPVGVFAYKFLSRSAPVAPTPRTGFQVVKRSFIDIDLPGLFFIFTLYISWVLLFSMLFSASRAALAAAKNKSPDHNAKAKRLRARFNKLFLVWLFFFLLIFILLTVIF